MFKFYLTSFYFVLVLAAVGSDSNTEDLPSWITDKEGFKRPVETDSIKKGNGSLSSEKQGNEGWIVYLNEKEGHGIELEVSELSLNPDSNDFLLISSWPLTTSFKQMKLFTGKFEKPLKKLRIPNTKTFFVLYSASSSTKSPKMSLNYIRYGTPLELNPLPTENPIKKKETVYEVQLKGKTLEEYADPEMMMKLKEGIRAAARRYSAEKNIPFNEEAKTEDMVFIHKITACPFEWPERQICASLKHSVFVSGVRIPDEEIILDYQLVAEHLRMMWGEKHFPELQELGMTVFELPPTYSTVFYWSLIIGLMIITSLIGIFIFWKFHRTDDSSGHSTVFEEIQKTKKPKLTPAKNQRIPSFMKESMTRTKNGEALLEDRFEDVKLEKSSQPPIQNYKDSQQCEQYNDTKYVQHKLNKNTRNDQADIASLLFNSNRAFEDDEDKTFELREHKPTTPHNLRIRATNSFGATNI